MSEGGRAEPGALLHAEGARVGDAQDAGGRAPGRRDHPPERAAGAAELGSGTGLEEAAAVGAEGAAPSPGRVHAGTGGSWRGHVRAAGLVVAATVAGLALRTFLAQADLAMIYLLVIMIVAATTSRSAAVLAAALSVAAYDLCFVPPYYTFAVHDVRHLLSFAMMFAVGLVISTLTARIRRQERHAREREQRTAALYALSREIAGALDSQEVARVLARQTAEVFAAAVAVRLQGASTPAVGTAVEPASPVVAGDAALDADELALARWVEEHGRPAGRGTDTLAGAGVLCVPIAAVRRVLGVLVLARRARGAMGHDERSLLDAFVGQGALALERVRLADEARVAALRARTEELRSSLLSAVSHDLRTPLAAITGAASAMLDPAADLARGPRHDLITTIHEEAERLERIVGDLLEMTRLDSGALVLRRDWVPVEELVGSALTRLEKVLSGRVVKVELPTDLPLVSVDPVLLEQVLVNLLENASRHAAGAGAFEIAARTVGARLELDVADDGPGIPAGAEERLFERFYRGPGAPPGGVGLGLAICRGIVEAHDGSLVALHRPGGGALFRLSLPLVEGAPSVPDGDEGAVLSSPRAEIGGPR